MRGRRGSGGESGGGGEDGRMKRRGEGEISDGRRGGEKGGKG